MPLFKRAVTEVRIFEDMTEGEKKAQDEYNSLDVSGIKGWTDFVYVFIFCIFSGLACSGVLMYFTKDTTTTPTQLSYAVRDHCGGYGTKWTLEGPEGKLVSISSEEERRRLYDDYGMEDNHDEDYQDYHSEDHHSEDHESDEHREDEGSHDSGDDGDDGGYYGACYREFALSKVTGDFQAVIEVYLLSILLFVCLVVEMKEFIAREGWRLFNIVTMVYYVFECVLFFWYFSRMNRVMSVDDGSLVWENNRMTSQQAMDSDTNYFIALVLTCRLIVGLVVTALIYKFKAKNTTSYIAQKERVRSCNKSCFFFIMIGLSSLLAVIVLLAYFRDDSVPAEHILVDQCSEKTRETYLKYCGRGVLSDCQESGTSTTDCGRCGYPEVTERSYDFFDDDEKSCISETLKAPMEDNINSYVLAYGASYLFFLIMLHGERNRFQSARAWYAYRIGFCLMLFVEAFVFVGFRNSYNAILEGDITLANPRPMNTHVVGCVLGVFLTRFIVLVALFVLEQSEVGWSYCASCCKFAGMGGYGDDKQAKSVAPMDGSDLDEAEGSEDCAGAAKPMTVVELTGDGIEATTSHAV